MKAKLLLLLCIASFVNHAQTFTCGDTLIDSRDGKKYLTVQIGSACWMRQNLNFGKMVTSYTSTVTHPDMFNNSIYEKYAYNNDSTNLPNYGALYEWDELMNYTSTPGGQGLCPNGWHVPTDAEWQTMIVAAGGTLITTAGGYGGNKLKNIGEGFGLGAGTNTSGFSAKHSGDRDSYGIFYGLGFRSIFWTSTPNGNPAAHQYTLWADRDTIARGNNAQKITGFACRCVRNVVAGIGEIKNSSFNMYPNPSNATVYFTLNRIVFNMEYEISDQLGNVIMKGNFANVSEFDLSTQNLDAGCYSVKIIADGETSVQKMIVVH